MLLCLVFPVGRLLYTPSKLQRLTNTPKSPMALRVTVLHLPAVRRRTPPSFDRMSLVPPRHLLLVVPTATAQSMLRRPFPPSLVAPEAPAPQAPLTPALLQLPTLRRTSGLMVLPHSSVAAARRPTVQATPLKAPRRLRARLRTELRKLRALVLRAVFRPLQTMALLQ